MNTQASAFAGAFSFLEHSMRSHDYVPGVSGWKLYAVSGELEINSCTLGSVGKAPDRQMVSVEVASYSKYDLPKNAANLVQFMAAELQKVPEEYRHAAEFEEFDASYGDDSFSPHLFLSYSRLETEEELSGRLDKAKVSGTRISLVDGVLTIASDGITLVQLGILEKTEQSQPFIIVDGCASIAGQVKEVIRAELRPGGLLHRSS